MHRPAFGSSTLSSDLHHSCGIWTNQSHRRSPVAEVASSLLCHLARATSHCRTSHPNLLYSRINSPMLPPTTYNSKITPSALQPPPSTFFWIPRTRTVFGFRQLREEETSPAPTQPSTPSLAHILVQTASSSTSNSSPPSPCRLHIMYGIGGGGFNAPSTATQRRRNHDEDDDEEEEYAAEGRVLEAWERAYADDRSWEALQEDESGLLRPIDTKTLVHA
jgi:hypothetical protein